MTVVTHPSYDELLALSVEALNEIRASEQLNDPEPRTDEWIARQVLNAIWPAIGRTE